MMKIDAYVPLGHLVHHYILHAYKSAWLTVSGQ
jgi:hypothetical protein